MDENKKMVGFAVLMLILLIIAFIIWFFLNGTETYISDDTDAEPYQALDCTAGNLEEGFFYNQVANTVVNHIKATFANKKVYKIYYSYEGTYRSNDVALQDETNLHIRYDEHMGGYGILNSTLSPTYSTVKTKTQINLFAKSRDTIKKGTAVFFFINDDDIESFLDYSRDQAADYYSKKGFSCTKQN